MSGRHGRERRQATAKLVDQYTSYCRRRGRSPHTVRGYQRTLRAYAEWAAGRHPADIAAAEVELGFLAGWNHRFELTHGRACAHGTLRLVIQALRSFYAFLDRYDLLVDADGQPVRDPLRRIDGPRPAQRANDWLRALEEQQLLAAAITPAERIVITLLRWSGLRCGEAVQLLVRDIDFDRHELHVRHSKTRTGMRTVPLLPELERELRVWLQHVQARQPVTGDTPLLVTRNGTPMKAQFIVRVVKRVAQRAALREAACFGGSTITPHTLRRTFATDLLNRGVRLESVAQLLGHASSQTTQRYYAELLPSVVRTEFYDAYQTTAPLPRPPEQRAADRPQHLRLIAGGRPA